MPFDLRRERAVAPRGELRIEGRHQGVGGDPHRRRGRIEEPEITRMPGVYLKPPHRVSDEIQRLDSGRRLGEIAPGQFRADLLDVEFWRDSRRVNFRQVTLDDFDQTPPQLFARLIIQHQHQTPFSRYRLQKIRFSNEPLFYHNTTRVSDGFGTCG
jgi:hypothetical protein